MTLSTLPCHRRCLLAPEQTWRAQGEIQAFVLRLKEGNVPRVLWCCHSPSARAGPHPEGVMLSSSSHQGPGNISSHRTLPEGSGQPPPGS